MHVYYSASRISNIIFAALSRPAATGCLAANFVAFAVNMAARSLTMTSFSAPPNSALFHLGAAVLLALMPYPFRSARFP